MPINLSAMEKIILEATLSRSMVSGADLVRVAETSDWQALSDAVKNLKSHELVEVSGNILNLKEFPYATIGVVPSKRHYLNEVLKQ